MAIKTNLSFKRVLRGNHNKNTIRALSVCLEEIIIKTYLSFQRVLIGNHKENTLELSPYA